MNNKIIYGIIYGIIILCIVFTILIGASVLSTGYKIADFLLALFLSAIGLYLMYKNIETAKVAPDPNPNSSSGIVDNENLDNENIDKTLLGVKEMLEVKMSYEQIISKFESSLSNMKTLENDVYLEKYTEYKENLNSTKNPKNMEILTDLINNNIYIQTINKYKDSDKNLNNINELYEHFINMYKIYAEDNYRYKNDLDLIDNLQKLKDVILSIKNNASYIYQFNSLIGTKFYNDMELNGNGTSLKEYARKLLISDDLIKTKYGKGEDDGKFYKNKDGNNAAPLIKDFINKYNMTDIKKPTDENPVFVKFRENVIQRFDYENENNQNK